MAFAPRPYQVDCIGRTLEMLDGGLDPAVSMATGLGKCLGRGTPVIMSDGRVKNVEDVRVGDCLMGPDSKPRIVLSLARGREMMYRVTPNRGGDPFVCNESHILSLKYSAGSRYKAGSVINISVRDYLSKSNTFKHITKGYRAKVEFEHRETMINPYFLGVWLGDGHTNSSAVTTADDEIEQCVYSQASEHGLRVRRVNGNGCVTLHMVSDDGWRTNAMTKSLRYYGLIGNKHIPHAYKANSDRVRLSVLAGLIDADGSLIERTVYEIVSTRKVLADDAAFLARSLGFQVTVSESYKSCQTGAISQCWRVFISGDTDRIPCRLARKVANPRRMKKDPLVTGIKVESIGEGDYYGFEIDGDKLFLLGDFTVTHNTPCMALIARDHCIRTGKRAFFTVHRSELADQISKWLARVDPDHPASREQADSRGNRSFYRHRYVVSLVQTTGSETAGQARLLEYDPKEFCLHVTDEAHHSDTDSYKRTKEHFVQNRTCRFLGFSATWIDGDGTAKGQRCGYNAVSFRMTCREAIELGWLVPLEVLSTRVTGIDWDSIPTNADGTYREADLAEKLEQEKPLHQLAVPIVERLGDRPSLFFGVRYKQVQALANVVNRYRPNQARCVFGEPRTSPQERQAFFREFGHTFQFGGTVGVVTEGVDLPNAAGVAICRPCQSDALAMQILGRVLRAQDGLLDAENVRGVFWHDPDARKAAIARSAKPNARVLDFVSLGARKLISPFDILGGDRPAAVREYAKKLHADGDGEDGDRDPDDTLELLQRAEDEWALIAEEIERRSKLRAKSVRYQTREVDLFDPACQAEDERKMTTDEFQPATEKQIYFLVTKIGFSERAARTRSTKAASAIISKWKKTH